MNMKSLLQRFHIALVTALVDARCLSTLHSAFIRARSRVDKCNASTDALTKNENAVTCLAVLILLCQITRKIVIPAGSGDPVPGMVS